MGMGVCTAKAPPPMLKSLKTVFKNPCSPGAAFALAALALFVSNDAAAVTVTTLAGATAPVPRT